jgi:hypothetical protein
MSSRYQYRDSSIMPSSSAKPTDGSSDPASVMPCTNPAGMLAVMSLTSPPDAASAARNVGTARTATHGRRLTQWITARPRALPSAA